MQDNIFSFGTSKSNAIDGAFKLCVWNVHKCLSKKLEADITNIMHEFDIFIMQEAVISKKWKAIWDEFVDHDWGFFRSFSLRGNAETGVLTGSRYRQQILDILPTVDREPILRTPKASGLSLIDIKDRDEKLLVVNTHAMNFNLGKPFLRQIRAIAEAIEDHEGPMIWAGDFNTWSKLRFRELARIAESLGLEWLIPEGDRRLLKLDHVLYRGIKPKHAQIAHHIRTSDHYPVVAEFELV